MSVEKELLSDLLMQAKIFINAYKNYDVTSDGFEAAFNNFDRIVSNIEYRQEIDERVLKSSLKEVAPVITRGEIIPSKESIVSYTVIIAFDADKIENEVKKMMTHNWKPLGGISTSFIDDGGGKAIQFTQAMGLYI